MCQTMRRGGAGGVVAMLEPLETRVLLSGNVTATLDGRRLIIVGDEKDNRIEIDREDDDPRTVCEIRGFDSGNTKVNGAYQVGRFENVRSVVIRLRSGADHVHVDDDVDLPGNLTIFLGSGADGVTFTDEKPNRDNPGDAPTVRIGGNVLIRGKSGDDHVDIDDTVIRGAVDLFGGPGHDQFDLEDNHFERDFAFHGGNDPDLFLVRTSTFLAAKRLHGGPGRDMIDDQTVSGSEPIQ